MSSSQENRPGIRLTRKDLEKIPVEERVKLFGHDPLEKEGGFISKWSVITALAIAALLIGITAFIIEAYLNPGIEPQIDTSVFAIPEEGQFEDSEAYISMKQIWLSGNAARFSEHADAFLNNADFELSSDVIREVQLYKIRAFLLTEEYQSAENLARILHSRYSNNQTYLSDLYYYRGHIIAKRENLNAAFGAFSESCALSGRYSDESCRIMRDIQRMNRPLW
jgi:hypothetical protein